MNDTYAWMILASTIVLLIIGCVKKNPLALWIVETLVMFAVFAVAKELTGTKGHVRGYTGRPRLRR